MRSKTVHYVFDEPLNGFSEAFFTLRSLSILGVGEHAKWQRIYQEHFDALAGIDRTKPEAENPTSDQISDELKSLSYTLQRWARIRVSLAGIKVILAGDDKTRVEAELSDFGWDTIEGLATFPADLFQAMDLAAIRCNQGVFGITLPDDPNAPKVGVINVS